jgi:hypothetical protein
MASETTAVERWELGSEFPWLGLPEGPYLSWPRPSVWFALGRHAMASLWEKPARQGHALWLPAYFCPQVADHVRQAGVTVRPYYDDPRRATPDWDTLVPAKGDGVVAVNHFGVRDGAVWRGWRRTHSDVVFIEDHTHDPFSAWARDSDADFAFTSVRKTCPVPEGGVLWSPRGHALPAEPEQHDWTGSALKLAGMIWKNGYLAGAGDASTKATFRGFQQRGEELLSRGRGRSLAPWTRAFLEMGFPAAWRRRREENVRRALELLADVPGVRPIFSRWPTDYCPFNMVLEFASEDRSTACHARLTAAGIYTAAHWILPPGGPADLVALSRRMRTLPVDYRYSDKDLVRAAEIIRDLAHQQEA